MSLNIFQREYVQKNIDNIHTHLMNGNLKFIQNIHKECLKKGILFSVLDNEFINNYKNGFSMLQYAPTCNTDLIRFLLYSTDLDINKRNRYGSTLLHELGYNTTFSNKFITELLSNPKLDINIYNNSGDLPIYTASFYGMKTYVKLLVCYGSIFDIKYCIQKASYCKHTTFIKWLTKRQDWNRIQFRCEEGLCLWSPTNHKYWPIAYKKMVFTMLCIIDKKYTLFEKELLYIIFEFTGWN